MVVCLAFASILGQLDGWMHGWMALLFDVKACSLGGHVKTENSHIQSNEMKNHFPTCLPVKLQLEFLTHLGRYLILVCVGLREEGMDFFSRAVCL